MGGGDRQRFAVEALCVLRVLARLLVEAAQLEQTLGLLGPLRQHRGLLAGDVQVFVPSLAPLEDTLQGLDGRECRRVDFQGPPVGVDGLVGILELQLLNATGSGVERHRILGRRRETHLASDHLQRLGPVLLGFVKLAQGAQRRLTGGVDLQGTQVELLRILRTLEMPMQHGAQGHVQCDQLLVSLFALLNSADVALQGVR